MKFKFVSLLNVVAVCALLLGAVSCKPTEDNVKPGTYDSEKSYAVSYCSNTISSGIGMQVEAQMGAAVKMPAYMLTDGGNHIVAVRVALLTESRDCEMFITRSLDGEPIVKKSFTPIIGTWTYVALDAPLEVTGTEDYYIGYTTTTSGYCLGFESGNRTSTNDLVYSNGEWVTLADLNLKGKLSIQAMMWVETTQILLLKQIWV